MARKKYSETELNMMKAMSINLKKIMSLKGLTQAELVESTGLPKSTVSDYVNGKTLMSAGNLQKMADALEVLKSDINPYLTKVAHKPIPLIGTICAGDGLLAEQNIEDYVHYPLQTNKQPDYALRVNGNSMISAGIQSGDIVFMRYAQWADFNGQIVAALINNDEQGTLKRMKWTEGDPHILLIPENDDFQIIKVLPNQLHICGVYMGHFRPEHHVDNYK